MILELKKAYHSSKDFLERHPFIVALVWAYILAVPFIHMRYSYYDDIWRDGWGYGWPDYTFRPLANCFYHIASMAQGSIQSIHPLTPYSIYCSVAIFMMVGWLMARALGVSSYFMRTLSAAALFASPFMVEVIMFRYDGITYALGALFAVLPLTCMRRWYTFKASALLCIAIQFYLPCVLIFPVAVIAYATSLTSNFRSTISFLLRSVIAMIIALGVEYIILHAFFHVGGPYGDSHLTIPMNEILGNAERVLSYVIGSLNAFNIINLLGLFAIAVLVALFSRKGEVGLEERALNVILILSAPIFVLIAEVLINLSESAPRYYLPLSFIYIFWIAFILRMSRRAMVPVIVALITALSALPMIASCTAAVDDQISFQHEVASQMLSGLDTTGRSVAINTTGTIDSPDAIHSEAWTRISEDYPVLRSMMSAYIDDPYNAWKTLRAWGMVDSDPDITPKLRDVFTPVFVNPCHMTLVRHSLFGNIYDDHKTLLLDYSKVKCT